MILSTTQLKMVDNSVLSTEVRLEDKKARVENPEKLPCQPLSAAKCRVPENQRPVLEVPVLPRKTAKGGEVTQSAHAPRLCLVCIAMCYAPTHFCTQELVE